MNPKNLTEAPVILHTEVYTFVLLLLVILFSPSAHAKAYEVSLGKDWAQHKSPHFRFMYAEHLKPLGQALSKNAGVYRDRLLADLGKPGMEHVTVVLCDSLSCMQKMAPEGARVPAWAAGMAFSSYQTVLVRADGRTASRSNLDSVFLHELAHLALSSAVDNRPLPRWFQEGFAIYQSGEWSMGRVTTLASGVLSGRLFSLQALEESFPESPADIQLAYAQSIDFVSYLLGRYGKGKFHKLIDYLGRGWTFVNAMEEAYDQGIFKIESDWHADLKMRFTWIPVITGTATLWLIATLALVAAWIRKRKTRHMALMMMDDEDEDDGEEDDDDGPTFGPAPPLTPESP